jgi:hypothetical protein
MESGRASAETAGQKLPASFKGRRRDGLAIEEVRSSVLEAWYGRLESWHAIFCSGNGAGEGWGG